MLRFQSPHPTAWPPLLGGPALLLCAALFTSGSALAQGPVDDESSPWINALSVGTVVEPEGFGSGFLMLGIHATSVRPGRVGADLAVLTVPRLLVLGALTFISRGGVALPVPLGSEAFLVPGVGVTLIGGLGGGGVGLEGGLQGGAAVIIAPGGRPLVRAGVNRTRVSGLEGSLTFLEFGLFRWRRGL